jgi:hypothetical protein
MHQMHILTTSVSLVVLRPNKFEIRKKLCKLYNRKTLKYYAMKLIDFLQFYVPKIHWRVELLGMHEGDNHSFGDEFRNLFFFLDSSFVYIRIFE